MFDTINHRRRQSLDTINHRRRQSLDTINHRRRQPLTLQNVGDRAKEPMKPVEDRTIFALRIAAKQCDERLYNQTQNTTTVKLHL